MKNYYNYTRALLACFMIFWGCTKKPTDFRSYLAGTEITYPGKVTNASVYPGNGRIMLVWNPSPDPSITKYVVYWNNNVDSLILTASSHKTSDTIKCIVNGLSEYVYTFFIYSYDANGNRSVVTEIDNARAYGSIYQAGLHNRIINPVNPAIVKADSSVTLSFLTPDTINITTSIQYSNRSGVTVKKYLSPNNNSIVLSDYNYSSPIVYQSSYIPVRGALDTFSTIRSDTFPSFDTQVMCDKSLFAEANMPNDMGLYQSDTRVSKLWDGSVGPQDYPNIFHSDANDNLPRTLSFDLGKVYNNLSAIEETGRGCCNNPDDFEVWGIADTTGALPTLASNNSGWAAQSVSLGWTLLKEVKRTDDGNAAFKTGLMSNPPPVRFIRIRVLHDANNESRYVNLSEITFWYRL